MKRRGRCKLATGQTLEQGDVADGFYWHIGSAKASRLQLAAYPGGVLGAQETAVGHAIRTIHSIRSGRFYPHPPAGGCPGSCPAVEFCWRYRRGWG